MASEFESQNPDLEAPEHVTSMVFFRSFFQFFFFFISFILALGQNDSKLMMKAALLQSRVLEESARGGTMDAFKSRHCASELTADSSSYVERCRIQCSRCFLRQRCKHSEHR